MSCCWHHTNHRLNPAGQKPAVLLLQCGQRKSSYTPNSTAARRRNWRRRPYSSCSPATHQTLRQQGGTGEDGHIRLAVQLHTKLCGSKEELEKTAIFVLQSSYTPNSAAARRMNWRRRPYSSCSPATHQTLRQQGGGTGEDGHIRLAVQLHTKLYGSKEEELEKTAIFILQSSYTPNSAAARRSNWRRRPHSSCRLDSRCNCDREDEELFQ